MFQQFLSAITTANTRETYARGLRYFEDWAGDAGVDVAALRVRDISAFREHLTSSLAGSSTNVYLSALRAFLRWAAEKEMVEPAVYQAASVVRNVKVSSRLPQVLRAEEVTRLLASPDVSTLTGARDLALVSLLVSSGLRISEAVNLDLADIDIQARRMRVVGKGDKERVARFNTRAQRALLAYLELRDDGAVSGPVFVNRWGRRISVRYMQERIAGYGLTVEGGERLHPHALRHTFATYYIDQTGDLDATRRQLGHSRAETTQRYTALATSRLDAQYDGVMERLGADDNDLVLELEPRRERATVERR